MKTITINKNSWSGDLAEIKIFKNKVSLYGVCGVPRWEDFKILTKRRVDYTQFVVTHPNWSNPIVTGYLDREVWVAGNGELYRTNICLHTAIAQVLFNIL